MSLTPALSPLKAPFPYYGGKRRVAHIVWPRFGQVSNYVEPFAGSLAILLARPGVDYNHLPKETVNDKDGFICNVWRAISHAPDEVARWADWPANENDLHARHAWLVKQGNELTQQLEGNPDYFDAKIAGWWLWGIALWIGSGWCSGSGPYQAIDGKLLHLGDAGQGINRQRLHLGNGGQGINRKRLHLGDAGQGINRQLLHLGNAGQGINRQRLHLGNAGQRQGVTAIDGLYEYMNELQKRLRRVRVCSGDWNRVTGKSVTWNHGTTAVFLDPPYAAEAQRDSDLYRMDCLKIAHDVREWAVSEGGNQKMRIALCGYEEEHGPHMPRDWEMVSWDASGGYGGQRKDGSNDNGKKERIWFSPHCLRVVEEKQLAMEF